MANLGFEFNDKEYKDFDGSMSFNVFDSGTYDFMITNSDVKRNNSDTGNKLIIEFTHHQGKYNGLTFNPTINITHTNKTTEIIGRKILATIKRAVNIEGSMKDSSMLHGKMITLELGQEKSKCGKYNNNTIEKIFPFQQQQQQQTQQPQQTTSNW